jgi:hypothetical protein
LTPCRRDARVSRRLGSGTRTSARCAGGSLRVEGDESLFCDRRRDAPVQTSQAPATRSGFYFSGSSRPPLQRLRVEDARTDRYLRSSRHGSSADRRRSRVMKRSARHQSCGSDRRAARPSVSMKIRVCVKQPPSDLSASEGSRPSMWLQGSCRCRRADGAHRSHA